MSSAPQPPAPPKLYWYVTLLANVYIGGVAKRETRRFDTKDEGEAWCKAARAEFGGFPTAYFQEAADDSKLIIPSNTL